MLLYTVPLKIMWLLYAFILKTWPSFAFSIINLQTNNLWICFNMRKTKLHISVNLELCDLLRINSVPQWPPGPLCSSVPWGPACSWTAGTLCGNDAWRPQSCWWTGPSPVCLTRPEPPGLSPEGRSRWRNPQPWALCSGRSPPPSWRSSGCPTPRACLLRSRSWTQGSVWRWPRRCWRLALNGGSSRRWSWWRWRSVWWLAAVVKIYNEIEEMETERTPNVAFFV